MKQNIFFPHNYQARNIKKKKKKKNDETHDICVTVHPFTSP